MIAVTPFLAVVGFLSDHSMNVCHSVRRCPAASGIGSWPDPPLTPFDVRWESRISGEVNFVKKIAVRKAGTVRLTAAASPLYGATCIPHPL
jgi:hypothetical protein